MNLARIGPAAVVATAVVTALDVLTVNPGHAPIRLVLVIVAYGAFATMLIVHHRRVFLTRRLVLGAVVPLLALAVVVPPHGSNDLWCYVMYGRTITVHHRDPYTFAPDQVGHDPLLARVDRRWRHQPAVYGPGFLAVTAVVTRAAGSSPTRERVAFQGMAALLALGLVLVVGRRTGDPAAMAWLGLNPGLVHFVVNLGHNDLLVGAAVLAAVLVAERRPALAGAVLGLGALVKIVALLALAALVVSALRTAGHRAAAAAGASGAGVLTAGYLLGGGAAALAPLRTASQWHTSASLATTLADVLPPVSAVLVCQLLVAAVVGVVVVRGYADPHWLVVAAVTVYLVGAPYVLPWYSAWVLPAAALAWRSRLAILVAAQSAAFAVISVDSRDISPAGLHVFLLDLTRVLLPALELGALAILVALAFGRRRRRTAPARREERVVARVG